MWRAFISLWKNIFNYTGKSSRKEFWLGSIAEIIFMYLLLIPYALVVVPLRYMGVEIILSPILCSIIHIGVCIIPLVSLYARRANDVGLGKFDIWLVAVAVPAVGAIIISMFPPQSNVLCKRIAWCYRCLAIGFGFFFYGGLISSIFFGSFDALFPVVEIGLALMTLSMIIGAIIVKDNQK